MALWDEKDQNSVRHCLLLPRTSKAVSLYFQWTDEGLTQTKQPEQKEQGDTGAMGRTTAAVRSAFKDGEPITHKKCLGAESTFYRWRKWAIDRGIVFESDGQIFLSPTGPRWVKSKVGNRGQFESGSALTLKMRSNLSRVNGFDSTRNRTRMTIFLDGGSTPTREKRLCTGQKS